MNDKEFSAALADASKVSEDEVGLPPVEPDGVLEAPEPAAEPVAPVEPAPAEVAPEVVETPAEEAERVFAGTFKSPEALEQGYLEIQRHLGELQADNGELRKLAARLEALETQEPTQSSPLAPSDMFERILNNSPLHAAEWARHNDTSGLLYQEAITQAYDDDPVRAAQYERAIEIQALEERLSQRFEGQVAPLAERAGIGDLEASWNRVVARHPEIPLYVEQIQREAETSHVTARLNGASPEETDRVLTDLYLLARARAEGTVAQATQAAAETQAAEATQAKTQAQVAVTGSTQARESSAEDEVYENFKKRMLDPPPYSVQAGLGS